MPDVSVPEVTGRGPDAACAELRRVVLECVPEAVVNDDQPEDEVFEQQPAAGQEVPPGTEVTVRVAVRSTVQVPPLGGLDPASADQAVRGAGLVPQPEPRSGAPADQNLNVVLDDQAPAAGAEAKAGDTVSFAYWADYAPIAFDPGWLLGKPQGDACTVPLQNGFKSCQAVQGADPAPTPEQEGVVGGVEPGAAGSYDPNTPITAYYFGPYQPKTITLRALPGIGCAPVDAVNAENPGINLLCSPVASPNPPQGPTAYNGVIAQDPAPGSVVSEGQTVTVYTYQPALREVIDWQRGAEATHTLRGTGDGAPGGNPGAWNDTGTRFQLFAGPEPGSAPVYCWSRGEGGTLRHYCGTVAPNPYDASPWTAGFGGNPIGYAYPGNPGFGVSRWTCYLVRTNADGTQHPIGMYYNGSADCVTPDNPVTDRYEIQENLTFIL
ncbi:PASTA domain-containing protein [Iamia sp.]|uniref:PASTA domain-containing protein n=1 Tax=Iamia sp. TaxID=2722710 RepID=UPI002C600411|nr:PASTA domain-containing protein [Iamia sp.]HXH56679.1 PASTA domain-containing protein [Iamia sp.]